MSIFQKSVINKYLKNLDTAALDKAFDSYKATFTGEKIAIIRTVKEEEYQDGFLRDLFVNVLGYKLNIDSKEHDLVREKKNQTDAKKADGAIIRDGRVTAVIELKDTKTKDMGSVTEQAFGYKNSQEGCKYVITSNFHKLRFYIDNKVDFEEFDLFELGRDDFELLYLLLNRDSIFNDIPAKLKEETKFHEETVSGKLYSDYSSFKKNLFGDMTKNNPQYDKLTLFKKSQKLIDRYLFILFSEDRGLLPPNSISRMITRFDVLKSEDSYKPLYEICRQYFGYMNTGNHKENIPAYNGGLFLPDEILDSIKIDDGILRDHLWQLSTYDYATEIDVNILGHIFEHSLSEIEEITATIEGVKTDKAKSKRKKDGVYYTPKYITQYIVENTVGTLCREKRRELGIEQIEFDDTYRKANGFLTEKGKILFDKLEAYKKWLITLKIVDPACGSGAFLNQALNFLIAEHKTIDDIIAELTASPLRLFDTDKAILENNLYGVDINDESVEIAKLSLWLHTARKDRKLSDLNNNIKCGNSLINDPKVAGDKAFDWHKEFPDIMQAGGFDVVIGNPPYVKVQNISKKENSYYSNNYYSAKGKFDIYILFNEKALDLINPNGLIGLIEPHKFLVANYGKNFRNYAKENRTLVKLISFSDLDIFQDAMTYTCLVFFKKKSKQEYFNYYEFKSNAKKVEEELTNLKNHIKIFYSNIVGDQWFLTDDNSIRLLTKLKSFDTKLKDITMNISQGVIPGSDKIYYLKCIEDKGNTLVCYSEQKKNTFEIEKGILKPIFKGNNIKRYLEPVFDYYIIYPYRLENNSQKLIPFNELLVNYPLAAMYLSEFEEFLVNLRIQYKTNPREWYGFHRAREMQFLESEKLVTSHASIRPNFTHIINPFYYNQNVYAINLNKNSEISYQQLIALLNSKICDYFIRNTSNMIKGGYYLYKTDYLELYPIPNTHSLSKFNNLINNAVNLLFMYNLDLQQKTNKFQNRIKSNFAIENISTKLESFYEHDFKTFVAELKKQKVSPTLKQQDEWEEYFNSYKKEINDLQAEIKKTDAEIDQMVYKLYELTDEEIKIVEGK